ncbi:hypothetical protein N431DRAFT_470406 [Stipitochalara longipes BDJ]|nr:hypothetical protein N431DRAFT_470406 [Stipitochalara longipes BDJ]
MNPQNGNLPTPTIIITLDDGYSCHMDAPLFLNQAGYIMKAFADRPLRSTEHRIPIPGVRYDASRENRHQNRTLGLLNPPPSRTFIIGESLQALAFQDKIMHKLFWTYQRFYEANEGRVPLGNVEYVFENSKNSCLRNFVADVLIFGMSERTVSQAFKEGHLSKVVGEVLEKRWDVMKDGVREAPWDHPGKYWLLSVPTGFS